MKLSGLDRKKSVKWKNNSCALSFVSSTPHEVGHIQVSALLQKSRLADFGHLFIHQWTLSMLWNESLTIRVPGFEQLNWNWATWHTFTELLSYHTARLLPHTRVLILSFLSPSLWRNLHSGWITQGFCNLIFWKMLPIVFYKTFKIISR